MEFRGKKIEKSKVRNGVKACVILSLFCAANLINDKNTYI